ncbi:ATP synthase subunit I [Virgibacillus sp. W0181]|uniref:ATP synthase subunit I n=1 Tax=Virgibacillus sp. W0181 TaxID=3391581 RepID=UPI003F4533CD
MLNYERMVVRQRKWMLYLLALLVLGAGLTPYTSIFFGLVLGSIISFYNLSLMQKKINDFSEAVEKKKKARGLGTLSRLAAVALGVLIVVRFEENIDLIGFIAGLMTAYFVIMLDFILFNR